MTTIYTPKGKAKEYGDYALNIYTGCPHRCFYCYSPSVLHRDRGVFHGDVRPRPNIVEETKAYLERTGIKDKLIHLCFTCDPYPTGHDSTVTREIIKVIKDSGNNVQILTKGDGSRDFDLLDENDWYGVTYAGYSNLAYGISEFEPGAETPRKRLLSLKMAKSLGIKTWVSCEPVLSETDVLYLLEKTDYIDRYKIGKLNYHESDIDWSVFGKEAERICKERGLNYYIKEGLRTEMMKM